MSHVLGVAFGDEAAPEGVLMLLWPNDEPLRFYETRLALALGDQLALLAANQRLAEAQRAQLATADATRVRPRGPAVTPAAPAPLGETLEALLRQEAPLFRAAGLTLRAEPHGKGHVALAAQDLSAVLAALLDNARRFSHPGGRVRLWLAQDEGWATIYVADDGCGIPQAYQGRIGEDGFQADPGKGGSGTSLAAAKRLVTASGGTLAFTSREGAGSTFYVTLPLTALKAPQANA
ncbi:Alginate biosynthesis sensor protein KinB [compost metagenome]